MLGIAIKVFSALFPFLQEVFSSKKGVKKKKPAEPPTHTWMKNVLIFIGLGSFILCFCLGRLYYESKKELSLIRDKQPKPTAKVVVKEIPTAPPPPPPTIDPPPPLDDTPVKTYPKKRIKTIPRQYHHPDEESEEALMKQIDDINRVGGK